MFNISHTNVLILLPFCNEAAYLERTLKSLVDQEYKDWILFAQDNCSDDSSAEIIRHHQKNDSRIHFVSLNQRVPVEENWNSVFETASAIFSSDYTMWLGGDDYLEDPNYLNSLTGELDKFPDAGACVPQFKASDPLGGVSQDFFKVNIAQNSRIRNVIELSANWANALSIYGLYRSEVFDWLSKKRSTQISNYEGSDWCWVLGFLTRHTFAVSEKAIYVKTFKPRKPSKTRIIRALFHVKKVFLTPYPIQLWLNLCSTFVLCKSYISRQRKSENAS